MSSVFPGLSENPPCHFCICVPHGNTQPVKDKKKKRKKEEGLRDARVRVLISEIIKKTLKIRKAGVIHPRRKEESKQCLAASAQAF